MKLSIWSLKSVNEKKLSMNRNEDDVDEEEEDDESSVVTSVVASSSYPIGNFSSAALYFMAFTEVVVLLKDVDNEVAYLCLVDIVLTVCVH